MVALLWTSVAVAALAASVHAQPSPEVQKRITAAIKAAANEPNPDLTAFVNPFIGTGELVVSLYSML